MRDIFVMVTKNMLDKEAEYIFDKMTTKKLNTRPSNVHYFLRWVVDDILGGIFDSWTTLHKVLQDDRENKHFMFVNELFYIWPLICGCQCVYDLDQEGAFNDIYKGSVAVFP